MLKDTNPTAEYFTDSVGWFAEQYQGKACFRDRFKLFISSVEKTVPRGGKILDFGCGPGVMGNALAGLGYDVKGLDGSAGMVQQARATAERLKHSNAHFDQLDATGFQSMPGQFDGIVCSSVIEYVPDDMGLVAKLVESLKPGGSLFISVPHDFHVFVPVEAMQRTLRSVARKQGEHLDHTHHRYNKNTLVSALEKTGLSDCKCTFFEFPLFGDFGSKLSRCGVLGRMLLVEGRKR